MKKWLLPTIIVCVLGIIARSIFGNKQLGSDGTSGSFLSSVPGDIDQLMYIKVDTELVSLMQTIESQSGYTGQPLATHLSGVQSLLVGQFVAGDQPINLLFIEANKETSITDLQQIGVIATEDTYTSKKLNSHTWVYGDTSALAYLEAYNGVMVDHLTGATQWVDGMKQGTYNVGFLSRGKGGGANPLVAQFGKKLEYTMALSHLALQKSEGNIIMQFTPGTLHPGTSAFTPKLASIVHEDPLLYIEFQNILGALGLSDDQVVGLLPILVSQMNPTFARLLVKDDYFDIVAVLHDNIAFSLDVISGGGIGLGAAILFHHPKAHTLAGILKPIFRQMVESFLGTGTINEQNTDKGFSLSVAIPGLEAMLGNGPLVSFSPLSGNAGSVLSILMDPKMVLGAGVGELMYTTDSIASFSVDTKAMERLQKSSPDATLNGLAAGQYLTQGVIKGHIIMDATMQQVRLIYEVANNK